MNTETITRPHECSHGHLARQCQICDRDEEIAELRAEIERLTGSLKMAIEIRDGYHRAGNELLFERDTEITKLRGDVERLLLHASKLAYALAVLHALVVGECPSILEDDHHDTFVRNTLDEWQSALKEHSP